MVKPFWRAHNLLLNLKIVISCIKKEIALSIDGDSYKEGHKPNAYNIDKFIHERNLNENKTDSGGEREREIRFSGAMYLSEYYFRDNNTNKGGQPVKIGPGHKPRLLRGNTIYRNYIPESRNIPVGLIQSPQAPQERR